MNSYSSEHPEQTGEFLPMCSVVIPIYNGEVDLPELLTCLEAQTYPRDKVEYLLVDNHSSDRTLAQIHSASENSPITIRPLSENQIQSSYAARNKGIRAATSQIIAFTDADCRPQPQWLKSLIQPFAKPNITMVAGEITALPGNSFLEKFADRQETLSQKHTLAHKFYPYGQTANLAIRRIAFEKVGLFRPYLTTGGDADICWRIQQENIGNIEFAPTAIVQHRHRATWKELESQWRRYGRSNRFLHELHGVDLMPEINWQKSSYGFGRWLVKEVPKNSIKALLGKASIVDLLQTPIGLFTANARYRGQHDAKLADNARNIDWM
jgi:glycosyltransferase involved in cell wall biosynthesis